MINNYFITALRSFIKNRSYALVNLFGLTLAFTVVLLMLSYIRYELSFDKAYSHSDRIYRIVINDNLMGEPRWTGYVPASLANTLKGVFPEVEQITHFYPTQQDTLVEMNATGGSTPVTPLSVDPDFFAVFNLQFAEGNPKTVWNDGDAIVISERISKELFPKGDAMGKMVQFALANRRNHAYRINGIIKDIPEHTHFRGDVFLSSSYFRNNATALTAKDFMVWYSDMQYVLLKKGTVLREFEKKVSKYMYMAFQLKDVQLKFIPVTDIHLKTDYIDNMGTRQSKIRYLYIYGMIGFLILSMACINYINLTVARAMDRFKEVGMRKVLGATTVQIRFQFIVEAFIFFIMSIPVAVSAAFLVWPFFTRLLDFTKNPTYLINAPTIGAAFGIAVVTAFISGWYPSKIMDRKRPVEIFRQSIGNLAFSVNPRKALVIFQFSIAVFLITATITIYRQLNFLNSRSMGFDKDYLIVLPDAGGQRNALKNELLRYPTIESISFAGSVGIGKGYGAKSAMNDPQDSSKSLDFAFVDADIHFQKTLKIQLVKGRYFSANENSELSEENDSHTLSNEDRQALWRKRPIVVTESLAKRLDIRSVDTSIFMGALQGTVIGIIKDFRMTSFKDQGPMVVLRGYREGRGNMYIRISSHIQQTMGNIQRSWKKWVPYGTFTYYFADDKIRQMYAWESKLVSLFTFFAAMAIGISALGLFSLVAMMVRRRTKEIGIRKVLGATLTDLSMLLSKDFIKLVLLAVFIASPLAWWGMDTWLEDYAYHIGMSWWIIFLAGGLAVIIALITVNIQAIRAALANPVDSLRDE